MDGWNGTGELVLRRKLEGFCNQLAARYGHPVYLVGGALFDPWVRDVDILIVLPDDEFEARYGSSLQWMGSLHRPCWSSGLHRWGEDMGKLCAGGSRTTRLNLDIKVEPYCWANSSHYIGLPRVRMDTLNLE